LHYSTSGEKTVTVGGAANQEQCGAGNHAAEVFNYSPEMWLPAAGSAPGNGYNAISSLPPVL
jgi:hypothetical protein